MYLDKQTIVTCLIFILHVIGALYLSNPSKFSYWSLKGFRWFFRTGEKLSKANILITSVFILIMVLSGIELRYIVVMIFGLLICVGTMFVSKKGYEEVSEKLDETIFV